MTQIEIKKWLEWGLSEGILEFDEGFYGIAPTSSDFYIVASHLEEADYYLINPTMQIALQEKIEKQGWFFYLRTSKKYHVLIKRIINNGEDFDCIATSRASTIPEAFMLAFREAWEATR